MARSGWPIWPPGSYELQAMFGTNHPPEWVAERSPLTVESGQATRDVQVSATRGGFLEVAVLGKADHQPIADAGINAYKKAYQAGAGSGTNGFALLRLPPGEYQVSAYKETRRSELTDATVEAGRTNHIEIELNPPPKIAGFVRDPSGAAVPDLRLFVLPNWGNTGGETRTDAKGRLRDAVGSPAVRRLAGGLLPARARLARNLAAAQDIEEAPRPLDLRLEPGLVVSGRVEDENGKPLTNATVRLYFWSGNSGSQFDDKPIRTDAQGPSRSPPAAGPKVQPGCHGQGLRLGQPDIQEDAETNRVEVEPCSQGRGPQAGGVVWEADEKPSRPSQRVHVRPGPAERFSPHGCEGAVRV